MVGTDKKDSKEEELNTWESSVLTKKPVEIKDTPQDSNASSKDTPLGNIENFSNMSKEEIYHKLSEFRKELTALRQKLNALSAEKEKWYEKKVKAGSEISRLIGLLKEAKAKRDGLTAKVRELKAKRDKTSEKLKKLVDEANALRREKQGVEKKQGIKVSPNKLRKEVEDLEYKLETEALSPDKEKKLMKLIKEKKKQFKELEKTSDIWDKVYKLEREIKDLKKENQERHLKVQVIAAESQKRHEELLAYAKQIDALRKEEEENKNKFLSFKREFTELNKKVKEKIRRVNALRKLVAKEKKEEIIEEEHKNEDILKKKEQEVMEKIKHKKKLTTEDLLVFQNIKH